MWIPNAIVAQVDEVARIYYINAEQCAAWNEHRHKDEIRLLTGWQWTSRDGSDYRQGFKTMSVCYRDAYYTLIKKINAPGRAANKPRLRRIA